MTPQTVINVILEWWPAVILTAFFLSFMAGMFRDMWRDWHDE